VAPSLRFAPPAREHLDALVALLAGLGVIVPTIVCTVVGVGLAAAGLRETTGNGASAE
jgi:hypothetical protein